MTGEGAAARQLRRSRRQVQPRLIPPRGAVLRAVFASLFSFFISLCGHRRVRVQAAVVTAEPPVAEEGDGGEVGNGPLNP